MTAGNLDEAFAYTGRWFDQTTKLQNNTNRWYDPATGRWLSEDPIGFAAGDANLYRYVGNGATNGVDPPGLATTVDEAIKGCMKWPTAGQRVNCLRDLLSTMKETGFGTPTDIAKITKLIPQQERLGKTAAQIISKECKGTINRAFPRDFRNRTLEEIIKIGQEAKGALKAKCDKALKLLNDPRFKKPPTAGR